MPVQFLTPAQRAAYGAYSSEISPEDLARYFHLDDEDWAALEDKRGEHNRLGYALQLTTARFLGTFLPNPIEVHPAVLQSLGRQLQVLNFDRLSDYRDGRQRWLHTIEIRARYGFREWTEPSIGFRLSRWVAYISFLFRCSPNPIFPNDNSVLRLLGCILIEQNDEWAVSRNLISKESLKKALALRPESKPEEVQTASAKALRKAS